MSQPFAVAQVFTGIEGRLVSLKDTIAAFKEILNGDHDALPESAFYSQYRRSGRPLPLYSHPHAINTDVLFALTVVGGIDDVKAKAQELQRQMAA